MGNYSWCGPTISALAILSPQHFSCFSIQYFNVGLTNMISNKDKFAIMNYRRTRFTQACPHVGFTHRAFPQFFPIEIVAKESA